MEVALGSADRELAELLGLLEDDGSRGQFLCSGTLPSMADDLTAGRSTGSGPPPVTTGVPHKKSASIGNVSAASDRSPSATALSDSRDHSPPAGVSSSLGNSSSDLPMVSNTGTNSNGTITGATEVSGPGNPANKREQDFDAIEDVAERRKQRRMAKNRVTAAKSRERKRAQFTGMNDRVGQLEAENASLQYSLSLRDAEIRQMRSELELQRSSSAALQQSGSGGSRIMGTSGPMQTSQASQNGGWGPGQNSTSQPQARRDIPGEGEPMADARTDFGASSSHFGSQPFADPAGARYGTDSNQRHALSNGFQESEWAWQNAANAVDRRNFLASLGHAHQQRFNTGEALHTAHHLPAQTAYAPWSYSSPQEAHSQQTGYQLGLGPASAPVVALQPATHHTALYRAPDSQKPVIAQASGAENGHLLGTRQNSERGASGMVGLDDGLMQYFWEHQDLSKDEPDGRN